MDLMFISSYVGVRIFSLQEGAPPLLGEADRVGTIQPGEEAQGHLSSVYNYLKKYFRTKPGSSICTQDKRQWAQIGTYEASPECQEALLQLQSFLFQKLPGHSSRQTALCAPA